MKTLVLVIASALAIPSAAFASLDLSGNMKQMAADLKIITQQIGDATQNANTIAAADDMIASISASQTFVPPSIQHQPTEQQAAHTQAYKDLLETLKGKIQELKADLVAGNNQAAALLLNDIKNIKAEGHQTYNPH